MKFVANAAGLVNAIAWVTKNYDSKGDRSYVALSINEQGEGHLSHGNGLSYMKGDFPVSTVDFSGEDVTEATFAVDGMFLRNLANAMGKSQGDATVSKNLANAKASLDVRTDLGKFTVPLLDFPVAKAPALVTLGEVDDNEFFDSLGRISKLCDAQNFGDTSFLGSVDLGFDPAEEQVTMFATDRYALARVSLGFSPAADLGNDVAKAIIGQHILLPAASASSVPPTRGLNTSITLVGEKVGQGAFRFGYSFPDGRVALFSLTNSTPYAQVDKMVGAVEAAVEHDITVPTSELRNAIKVISALASDEYDIHLAVDGDGLKVSDSNGANSLEVAHSDLNYQVVDETYESKYNRVVINTAFSPIGTASVRLKWGANSTALILEPVAEDGTAVDNVFVMAVLRK